MIDTVACLIVRVINLFLIDIVKEVQAKKFQVYESATCTNLQPVTLLFEIAKRGYFEISKVDFTLNSGESPN